MHMNPAAMDADGLLNGRSVDEGEKIGVVSNYLDHPNGTSRHLHFDVQVFTRDGWLWVNPYVTLISAYERLIGGRGREIGPEIAGRPTMRACGCRRTPVLPAARRAARTDFACHEPALPKSPQKHAVLARMTFAAPPARAARLAR